MNMDSIITAYGGQSAFMARLIAAVIMVFIAFFCTHGVHLLLRFIYHRIKHHMPEWLQIIGHGFIRPILLMVRMGFLYIASFMLVLDSNALVLIGRLFVSALIILLGWGFWRSAEICHLLLRSTQNRLDLQSDLTLNRFFMKIYRAIVVLLTVIAVLDIFNVPVAGLLTGAGIVGVAASLAAQSTLSNLLAGVMLVLEHPFGIGDIVILGSFEGTVEEISFRSTRLRTWDNVLVSVENSKVSAEYIQNITNRTTRALLMTVGVTYDTPREKLEKLTKDFITMFKNMPDVCTDRIYVNVVNFSSSSIDIQLRTYTTKISLADFASFQNAVHLAIMDVMAADGCSFAFPSTSVYIEKSGSDAS